ncbi:hypothetical protein [Butyrivibrio sp. INlla16]|uniref:hypothetical protein n=1 Tax=Butyrivibrio sp. INlla16 TaxID=1520807 RepID=UPI000883999E|nr:hypothetical protein [Butyrivibrio sp. INlla16]SDB21699.1 hypothetical protein SAMN02910263_01037 [Butyrivibrio sp. INlla16]
MTITWKQSTYSFFLAAIQLILGISWCVAGKSRWLYLMAFGLVIIQVVNGISCRIREKNEESK